MLLLCGCRLVLQGVYADFVLQRVDADFSANGAMYLRKGWKTFLRSKNIPEGWAIFFSYDGDETLWARFFDSDGDRVGCCFESASSSDEDFHHKVEEATDEEVDFEDEN